MIKNYLKTALRNLLRFKVYSAINIIGLAVGMAACLLIFLYVQNDMSFDKFNKNYNRIYRVVQEFKQNGKDVTWAITPTGYANAFPTEFPGVKSVRTSPSMFGNAVVRFGDKVFAVTNLVFADSTFFDVFSFTLIEGNPGTALAEPFSVVLSQSEAHKVFGSIDPVGKIIKIDNLFDFKVTGVAKDPPPNSSVQFGYLSSFTSLRGILHSYYPKSSDVLNNFNSSNYYTFLLLPKGLRVETIRKNIPAFLTKIFGEYNTDSGKLLLQPLRDVHFNRTYLFDFPNKGDIQYDYILSGIALFILLIACVNFINISTARSATRAKEIGVRKVLGSNRSRLVWQFILEFAALALISLMLALVLVELFLPSFDSITRAHLSASLLGDPEVLLSFLGIWMLVVISACAYPSFYLSSFRPASVMKGSVKSGSRGGLTRKSLIVFQFAISVFLIAVTIVMWSQYNFLKSHKLGFDSQQVLFSGSNMELNKTYRAFKSQLLQRPEILSVTRANWIPGHPQDIEGYSWTGKSGEHSGSFYTLIVDPDYAKVLGLKFAAGRDFSWQMPSDWSESFVLNETAAKMMGWTPETAIGQTIKTSYHPTGHVIGVVKDFNFKSLQQKIEPVVMLMDSSVNYYNTIAVKISSRDIPGTVSYVRSTWRQFSPDLLFDFRFLDQSFEELYQSEQRLGEIFGSFSILSILIACLGLFGLASYAVQERTKEMGIRKVVGASVIQIVKLVLGDFLKFVVIANVIAWPLAYYAMQRWLQNFAYRIDVGIWIFVVSGLVALVISLATVSWQAIKAATANPVEALRYE